MAINYYDDALILKLKKWVPEESNLRILKPDESKRLFELTADDNKDNAFKLPLIALSRSNDIELLSTTKQPKSYDGLKLSGSKDNDAVLQFNVIPIKLNYQLDIYTKTYEEGDEYLRNFLFKLINNPVIKIEIPYNGVYVQHIANIRIQPTVSDTSAISERIFSGQFTRWTIQLEIMDAFLFSIPYRKNWKLYYNDSDFLEGDVLGAIELSNTIVEVGETEEVPLKFQK